MILSTLSARSEAPPPFLRFDFDEVRSTRTKKDIEGETVEMIHEVSAGGQKAGVYRIDGYHDLVDGVAGKALMFDGYTTRITLPAESGPKVDQGLTVQAWVALGAYPWNWTPIATQEKTISRNEQKKDSSWPDTIIPGEKQAGWFCGIGPRGQFALMVAVDGKWRQCISDDFVFPRQQWVHAAATYDPKTGADLYINGKKIKTLELNGPIDRADVDLMIGMNREQRKQSHPVRPFATLPTWFALDGIIDDLTLVPSATTAYLPDAELKPADPAFEPRVMPSGPDSDAPFGAYYHQLKYYKQWDRLWPVGSDPDIVIRFDNSPVKVVFWRGTRYGPAWVTENGLWMGDQSIENFNGEDGCIEHMLDPHCRFSHVRIIESSPARAVVHWRYCPVAANGRHSQVDSISGWADWVDEYYFFYPDQVGMRKVVLHTQGHFLWPEEVIGLCHPGQRPEDVVELSALKLVNLKGQSHTYTWAEKSPKIRTSNEHKDYIDFGGSPQDPGDTTYEDADEDQPVIVMVNTKSKHRPFQVVEPDSWMAIFGIERRPGVSHFPWWNHWPVSQLPSDGRYCQAPDRASSFSLAWASPRQHQGEDRTFWWAWMYGMTDKPAESQVPLAASWLHAPKLRVTGKGYAGGAYQAQERCYHIASDHPENTAPIILNFDASEQSPVHNIPLVIENFRAGGLQVKVNGEALKSREDYRVGNRTRLDQPGVVLFIETEARKPVTVEITRRQGETGP